MLFTNMYSSPMLQLTALDLYRNTIHMKYKSNMYASQESFTSQPCLMFICWLFLICFEIKKSPLGLKLLSMLLQDNSFKTRVLILHQDAALFLPNKPWNKLSDFFCTLNCADKDSIIEIKISRFTCVFISFAKTLPKR